MDKEKEKLLIEFLISAKKQTYANSKGQKAAATRIGSKDYDYFEIVEGQKLTYHDTYFGGSKFIGEEVVYMNSEKPVWGMNYYGFTLDTSITEEFIDKALRPALMKVGEDETILPLRGPKMFKNGNYVYTFKLDGDLQNFVGVEKIYNKDKLIYILHCHGGGII